MIYSILAYIQILDYKNVSTFVFCEPVFLYSVYRSKLRGELPYFGFGTSPNGYPRIDGFESKPHVYRCIYIYKCGVCVCVRCNAGGWNEAVRGSMCNMMGFRL